MTDTEQQIWTAAYAQTIARIFTVDIYARWKELPIEQAMEPSEAIDDHTRIAVAVADLSVAQFRKHRQQSRVLDRP